MVNNEIWVYIECCDGVLTEVCAEIASEAKRLAQQKQLSVHGLYVGTPSQQLLDQVCCFGIEKIYALNHPSLATYTTDAYVKVLANVIDTYHPFALFMPATTNCQDFAPRLAAHLKLGLTTDCVKFQWGTGHALLMTRTIFKNRSFATYSAHVAGTQLATILPKAFPKLQQPGFQYGIGEGIVETAAVEFIPVDLKRFQNRTKVLGFIAAEASSVDISEATLIVAGGRGAKNKDGFQIIHQLAEELGASVGASRVATDEGWVPFERQIGQTGKIVAPKLYIACGISGAVHHTMGIKDSDRIISINTDKSAAIFGISDLGLVGDMHEVLPLLVEKIKTYKAKNLVETDEKKVVGIH